MTPWLIAGGVLWIGMALWLAVQIARSPVAIEDEHGFHRIEPEA